MCCEFCSKASKDVAWKTDFSTGMNNFKKETVKKNGKSQKHRTECDFIIAKSAPKETRLAHAKKKKNKNKNSRERIQRA